MIKSAQKYWFFLLLLCFATSSAAGQNRTIIEFYSEVPVVSDYVMDIKTEMSSGVSFVADGWKIPPGQNVKLELLYIPPNTGITEVRLGFAWEGQVVSGVFEGWSVERFKYKVFEEAIYPHENQKRIFPGMFARGYEFWVICNLSFRPEKPSLILQSLVIYWETVIDE
jgi:hypothetical protein